MEEIPSLSDDLGGIEMVMRVIVEYPDYETMQQYLEFGYLAYAENLSSDRRPVFIAPVGMAFENIFLSISNATEDGTIFSDLYAADGSHPSIQGTYLAACVIHTSVTGESTVGLPSTGGINASRTLEGNNGLTTQYSTHQD